VSIGGAKFQQRDRSIGSGSAWSRNAITVMHVAAISHGIQGSSSDSGNSGNRGRTSVSIRAPNVAKTQSFFHKIKKAAGSPSGASGQKARADGEDGDEASRREAVAKLKSDMS